MPDEDLKQQLRQGRQAMMDGARRRLNAHQDGRAIVKYISASVDAILIDLWRRIAGPLVDRVDLVGVGGYGRAELCPHSDWDLLFLAQDSSDEQLRTAVQRVIQVLWDSGAKIGHAVRTPAGTREHTDSDHHARTALLESRLVTGRGALYAEVQKKCGQQHWSKRQRKQFCIEKMEECAERRHAMGDTAFLMEPDVKSGTGGLRDVSTIFWLSMAWYGVPAARELIGRGVVSDAEFSAFVHARNALWRVRTGLHLLADREDDRLRFEYQQELAARFGFRDSGKMNAVERFIKTYFLHVRAITDLSGIFLLHFREQIDPPRRWRHSRDLGGGMVLRAGKVSIDDAAAFAADPLNLLRVFVEAQKEHRYLDSRGLRVIRNNARLMNSRLRTSKAANRLFLSILRSPRNVATVLGQMHETGILGRFIPDFGRITAHGQFDRYHSYTVDAHTIRAIDILRDFRLGEGQFIDMPLASSLMREIERPELLYVALLFHDIAKGRGGDHSQIGEQLARKFCQRLDLSRDDTELVAWLVLHHLRLSRTAQHYDLSDPNVIAEFSRFVGDRERLIHFFLLTVADVAAVGPGVWTDWKGALFTTLFDITEACLLAGQVLPDHMDLRLDNRRESVLAMCETTEREQVLGVLSILSKTCMLHFPPVQLLELCRLLSKRTDTRVTIHGARGSTQLLAWGDDRPKLFSHLTAALAGANIKVLSAHAYALRDGRVLDEFHISGERDEPVVESRQINRLRKRVQNVLDGGQPPPISLPLRPDVLMQALPVRVRHFEAAAKLITAIEVVAADRKGLLADLAMAIAGLDIDLRGANISTFGEKAVDVFFMTDRLGNKLSETQTETVIQRLHDAAQFRPAECA